MFPTCSAYADFNKSNDSASTERNRYLHLHRTLRRKTQSLEGKGRAKCGRIGSAKRNFQKNALRMGVKQQNPRHRQIPTTREFPWGYDSFFDASTINFQKNCVFVHIVY